VRRGTKLIVSHCPHCVNSFKQDYPQLGGDYEVMHHTEYLAKLVAEGRLPITAPSTESAAPVTYHDPCYLARVGGVTEPPRELLRKVVEMPRNRRETSCCGAGGGRMWFDDPPSERVGTGRAQEALDTGAKTVAVGCPFCLVMLNDGIAARQADVQVKDVAELLAEALVSESAAPRPA
jgi:Fe-S oxidoreductase